MWNTNVVGGGGLEGGGGGHRSLGRVHAMLQLLFWQDIYGSFKRNSMLCPASLSQMMALFNTV